MNPYKQIPIYGPEIIKDYVGRSRIELPPHIFSIAEEAFRSMLNEKENQCIIISGESGAGKSQKKNSDLPLLNHHFLFNF